MNGEEILIATKKRKAKHYKRGGEDVNSKGQLTTNKCKRKAKNDKIRNPKNRMKEGFTGVRQSSTVVIGCFLDLKTRV